MAFPFNHPAWTQAAPRSLKGLAPVCDVAGAVAELVDELLGDRLTSTDSAARALERLRGRMNVASAVLWVVDCGGVRRAVHLGNPGPGVAPAIGEFVDGSVALERLQRNGTILGRSGEISGVEALVPEGVRSFLAAAATPRGAVTGVLVLGWLDPVPPCDQAAAGPLRIAAALLARTFLDADHADDHSVLHEAVFGSLSDPVAVVDRLGTIVAVNAAWTDSGLYTGIASSTALVPGASYLEVGRRAVDDGSLNAAALEGVEAVCSGRLDHFETAYACQTLGDEHWCAMKVTRLRRPEGGAVITHTDVSREKRLEFALRLGDRLFRDLADMLPVPLWVVTPDGHLAYGNHAWAEVSGGNCVDGRGASWIEACHPDDRAAALSAFRSSAAHHEPFDLDVRLPAGNGDYRWWTLTVVPRVASDGRPESYIGVARDATDWRAAQRALREIRGKLVAAQETERSRIARELHDDLGQQVALLTSRLDTVIHTRELSRNRMLAGLGAARKSLRELATSIHNLSHELHPAKLKLLGLGPTLDILCRSLGQENDVDVTFASEGLPADVPEESAFSVFRVAQEALQNALKHSAARRIEVHLAATPSQLDLRVTDDGVGFDPTAVRPAGLGLLTMRERVELVGGRLTIDAGRSKGTTIVATVPMTIGAGAAL